MSHILLTINHSLTLKIRPVLSPTIGSFSPELEKNGTLKCISNNFLCMLTYMLFLKKWWNYTSMYRCSSIQGKMSKEGGCECYSKYIGKNSFNYFLRILCFNRCHLATLASWPSVKAFKANFWFCPCLVDWSVRKQN